MKTNILIVFLLVHVDGVTVSHKKLREKNDCGGVMRKRWQKGAKMYSIKISDTEKGKELKCHERVKACCGEHVYSTGESYLVLARVNSTTVHIHSPKIHPFPNETDRCTLLKFGDCQQTGDLQIIPKCDDDQRRRRSTIHHNDIISTPGQRLRLDFNVKNFSSRDPTLELVCPKKSACNLKELKYVHYGNREITFQKSELKADDLGEYKLRLVESASNENLTEINLVVREPFMTETLRTGVTYLPDLINCIDYPLDSVCQESAEWNKCKANDRFIKEFRCPKKWSPRASCREQCKPGVTGPCCQVLMRSTTPDCV